MIRLLIAALACLISGALSAAPDANGTPPKPEPDLFARADEAYQRVVELNALHVLNALRMTREQLIAVADAAQTSLNKLRQDDEPNAQAIIAMDAQLRTARVDAIRGKPVPASLLDQMAEFDTQATSRRRRALQTRSAELWDAIKTILTESQRLTVYEQSRQAFRRLGRTGVDKLEGAELGAHFTGSVLLDAMTIGLLREMAAAR